VDEDLGCSSSRTAWAGTPARAASRLAVETMQPPSGTRRTEPDAFRPTEGPAEESPLPDVLREAVEEACAVIFRTRRAIRARGDGHHRHRRARDGRTAYVAHVGDSRCYLLRDGRIYQVSEDHSLVNEQLKAGAITEDEARHSRFKNIITRSVGFEQQVQVDLMGVELEADDRLVVCCDGLSNLVEDAEILEIVQASDFDLAPGRLVALANDRGGDDNITVIVLRAVER